MIKRSYTLVLRGILQDPQGRFLLMQRSAQSKGWPGKWEFPGGKVDRGEELTQALIREWKEETGLAIVPLACLDVFAWEHGHDRILYFIFRVRAKNLDVKKSFEHDAWGWFTAAQIKKLDVAPALKQVIKTLCV
jgi:8-oxo-dGTP diphosphatase